jgi:hypothetical protein
LRALRGGDRQLPLRRRNWQSDHQRRKGKEQGGRCNGHGVSSKFAALIDRGSCNGGCFS